METESKIADFYANKSVFITGGTGFIGKALIEKLLRSCNRVKHIYVLIRSKKGNSVSTRLRELLQSPVFDSVRESHSKVLAIEGDVTLFGLGISDNDLKILVSEVSVVFHTVASVRFNEPLKKAVEINVLGTRRLLELCHKLTKIEAVIHVSTAYSNCNRYEIDERLYWSPESPQKIIDLCQQINDEKLEAMTPQLLKDWPNTYTFTKALTENMIANESGTLPMAIVRPSIVTGSLKEPLPGWVDNLNGATGLVIAAGKGVLRHMFAKPKGIADIIPVDTVVNLMVALVWFRATIPQKGVPFYNSTSGVLNPINWDEFNRITQWFIEYPCSKIYRYPGVHNCNSKIIHKICVFFNHIIPAYIFDGLMALSCKKRIMVKTYRKFHRNFEAFEWVTTREWKMTNYNSIDLYEQLNSVDKQIFNFDIRGIDWPSYLFMYSQGIRKYVLKEDDNTLSESRRNLKSVYIRDIVMKATFLLIIILIIITIIYLIYLSIFENKYLNSDV